MKINEAIKKFRKERNMTQEQIAGYLGVTASAVNKWERAISYPDITLLAPLARILQTDVDTLVSFREELTDSEINDIVREISEKAAAQRYDEAFEDAADLIKEYPDCDKLTLTLAQTMNMYLDLVTPENRERYRRQIEAWFQSVMDCHSKELADMAAVSLCQNLIAEEKYEESQAILDKIPALGFDKRIAQANLYSKREKYDEAYGIHESMMLQSATAITLSIMKIIELNCRQKDYGSARMYAKLCHDVSETFGLSPYNTRLPEFMVAVELKDKEECFRLLERLTDYTKLFDFQRKELYRHVKMKENTDMSSLRKMLKISFENDKSLDFLRGDKRFQEIIARLSDE